MLSFNVAFENVVLIDTSAAIALKDPNDEHYQDAKFFFESSQGLSWVVLNETSHESYTKSRYDFYHEKAIEIYNFLTDDKMIALTFDEKDEEESVKILKKYSQHCISYHDALCAVIMKKAGIYKIFTFDSDFWTLGFQIVPGITKKKKKR
ncbi:MAG: PIN domain-containing protein [Thermodesulfobacteriota bacterium]